MNTPELQPVAFEVDFLSAPLTWHPGPARLDAQAVADAGDSAEIVEEIRRALLRNTRTHLPAVEVVQATLEELRLGHRILPPPADAPEDELPPEATP